MSDLIDRQAAIDAVYERIRQIGYENNPLVLSIRQAIRDLPSAHPEPCDDPRADVYYLAEKIGIHQLYALVVELRGEPEPHYCRECKWSMCHINVDKYGSIKTYWHCLYWAGETDEEGFCHEWERNGEQP